MIAGIAAAAIAGFLAVVIRLAISRRREFVADAGSVELTKNPDAMISALQKVAGHAHLDAPEEMRGLFLENREDGIFGLFATHPPIEARIDALVHYAGGRVTELQARARTATGIRPAGRRPARGRSRRRKDPGAELLRPEPLAGREALGRQLAGRRRACPATRAIPARRGVRPAVSIQAAPPRP